MGEKSNYISLDFLSFGEIKDIEKVAFKRRHWIDYNPSKQIKKLKKLLCKEKSVRIWTSRSAVDEYCALLYVVYLLKDTGITPMVVFSDEATLAEKDGEKYNPISTTEFNFSQIEEVLEKHARELTPAECEEYYNEWKTLATQNAPLRIVRQGKVVGVPADYCDEQIFKIIRENGNAIKVFHIYDKYRYFEYDRNNGMLGSTFIDNRIEELIADNKIIEVEKGIHPDYGYCVSYSIIKLKEA